MASAPPQDTLRVLVTDGEQRCALAACRALSKVGFDVGAASAARPAAAQWSNHVGHRVRVADPRRDARRFAYQLRDELKRERYDVLLPGGDATLLAISAHRARLEPLVRLGLPPHAVIEGCIDKELLVRRAEEVGFAPPATTSCDGLEDGRAAARRLGYPVIVKPRRSFSDARGAERKPIVVHDDVALAAAATDVGAPFLVQEFLPDAPVLSCAGVAAEGRLVGFVTARYERVWPPDRGSVACSETIAPPPELRARVERLVTSLGWCGVFEIELLERRGGGHAVIDLNTRVYGSLALAVRAGSNLPAIWCRYLVTGELAEAEPTPGLRYRWEDGELLSLLRSLARGDVRTAAEIARADHNVVWAHYEPRDVGPLLARFIYLGRRGLQAAGRSAAARFTQQLAAYVADPRLPPLMAPGRPGRRSQEAEGAQEQLTGRQIPGRGWPLRLAPASKPAGGER